MVHLVHLCFNANFALKLVKKILSKRSILYICSPISSGLLQFIFVNTPNFHTVLRRPVQRTDMNASKVVLNYWNSLCVLLEAITNLFLTNKVLIMIRMALYWVLALQKVQTTHYSCLPYLPCLLKKTHFSGCVKINDKS